MTAESSRSLSGDTRGVVYVEFLLCFIPVFLLFLGVVQMALISSAKLIVQHAAYRGARAASVILSDDEKFYDNEPQGFLGEEKKSSDGDGNDKSPSTAKKIGKLLDVVHNITGVNIKAGLKLWKSPPSGQRLADIRRAAYLPLCALAPTGDDLWQLVKNNSATQDLASGIGDQQASRLATGLLLYNDASTVLRFRKDNKADGFYETRVNTSAPDITLQITHLYRCSIPLVSSIICRSGRELGSSYAKARVTDDGKNKDAKLFDDLDHIPSRAGLTALLASRARFFVLRQQATVAAQWAPYSYRRPES